MALTGGSDLLTRRAARCPRCNSTAINRWSQSSTVWRASCSNCSNAWTERSRRNLVDSILDRRDIGFAIIAFAGIGFLLFSGVVSALLLLGRVDERGGSSETAAFAVTIILSLVALVVIARKRVGR